MVINWIEYLVFYSYLGIMNFLSIYNYKFLYFFLFLGFMCNQWVCYVINNKELKDKVIFLILLILNEISSKS